MNIQQFPARAEKKNSPLVKIHLIMNLRHGINQRGAKDQTRKNILFRKSANFELRLLRRRKKVDRSIWWHDGQKAELFGYLPKTTPDFGCPKLTSENDWQLDWIAGTFDKLRSKLRPENSWQNSKVKMSEMGSYFLQEGAHFLATLLISKRCRRNPINCKIIHHFMSIF